MRQDKMINNPVGADLRACFAYMNENTGSPLQKDLPEGWFWKTMGEISDVIGGGTPRTNVLEYYNDGNIPWITPADLSGYNNKYISHGSRFITEAGLKNSSARLLPSGTVLFTTRAPIGYVAIASNPISTNQGFKSFVLKEGILPDYVYWYLKGNKYLAESYASGTTFLELAGAKAKQIPIPIAPPNEQKLIVAEIEKQFSRLDEAVANLKRVKANLKRYKAAVLKAAVEGKLTEEWRKANPDAEPASELLKSILAERRRKWEEVNPKKKYKEPAPPDTSNLPELPKGWVWSSTDQLTWYITSGSRDWKKYYSNKGVLFIRTQDINKNKLELENVAYVDLPNSAEGKRSLVECEDMLVIITGANVGKVALVDKVLPEAYVSQSVGLMKLSYKNIARYLHFAMIAEGTGKTQLEKMVYGMGRPVLNLENLHELQIPLPPYNEQLQIVAEVEQRLSIVNEIENSLGGNLSRAERLRQSILQCAFRGDLNIEKTKHDREGVL